MRFHRFGVILLPVLVLVAVPPSRAGVDVELTGLEDVLERNVELSLGLRRLSGDPGESEIRRLHERAPEEIRQALQPFGYYAPTIDARLETDGKDWKALYAVEPGPVVRIERLDIRLHGDGAEDSSFVELVGSFPLAEGDVLEHAAYARGKNRLALHAKRHGYLDAAFDSSVVRVHVERSRAEIVLHLNTGPRYRFGDISLQQDVLDDDMVRGYALARPGEPLDVDLLLRMQDELGSTTYFRDVEITARREDTDEDLQVPIDIVLTPARTQRYEVGAGYGTDTGFRGKLAGTWRRLNRRGHHAEATVQGSQVEFSTSARYMIPWPYPRTEELAFFGGIGRFDPDWSTSWRSVLGLSLDRTRGSWNESFSLAYEHESFSVSDQEGISNLLIPGVAWTRVKADDRIFPTRGSRIGVELEGASTALASSTDFVRLMLNGKWIRRPFEAGRIIARGTVGRMWPSRFEEMPPTLRFVTGGDQTVRGFAFESLGPRNDSGDLIGGNSLLVGSLELELLVFDPWGLAFFVDAGDALDAFAGTLESGAGVGIRWRSPIGMVRVDGAFPISDGDDSFRVHFAIGPDL